MKKTLYDYDFKGKRVIVRVDFNVPLKNGVISNALRIDESLPTINYLREHGARVILCSHLGRPDGEAKPEFTLMPVKEYLEKALGINVVFCPQIVGEEAVKMSKELSDGDVMLLENVRYRKEEEECDDEFSKQLSELADIYVNDAFGTAHRKHASTYGIAKYLPSAMGFLMQKEVSALHDSIDNPERPFVAILGGAKVKDKIKVVKNLLNKVDTLIIGGGMSYTFQKAQGYEIGTSLLDSDNIDFCKEVIAEAKEKGVNLLLPVDVVCAKEYAEDAEPILIDGINIPSDLMGLDIGPKTIKIFVDAIKDAKTVVWNGPMGVFEFENFAKGTRALAQAIADNKECNSIIGGGDTASSVINMGFKDQISHVSTGGGASLKMLEGKLLDGIQAISDKE